MVVYHKWPLNSPKKKKQHGELFSVASSLAPCIFDPFCDSEYTIFGLTISRARSFIISVTPHLCCGDIWQIRMRFKEFYKYLAKIEIPLIARIARSPCIVVLVAVPSWRFPQTYLLTRQYTRFEGPNMVARKMRPVQMIKNKTFWRTFGERNEFRLVFINVWTISKQPRSTLFIIHSQIYKYFNNFQFYKKLSTSKIHKHRLDHFDSFLWSPMEYQSVLSNVWITLDMYHTIDS